MWDWIQVDCSAHLIAMKYVTSNNSAEYWFWKNQYSIKKSIKKKTKLKHNGEIHNVGLLKSVFYMSYMYQLFWSSQWHHLLLLSQSYFSSALKEWSFLSIFLLSLVLQWTHSLKSVEYFAWSLHSSCCTLFLLQILD